MTRVAFVTGASGFLGVHLVSHLCQQGWKVYAMHRPGSRLDYIRSMPVRLIEGTLSDREGLNLIFPRSVDGVFHTAANVSLWSGHAHQQFDTNVIGTMNLIEAAQRASAKRFIYTSTICVWGFQTVPFDETFPKIGATSWINYFRTKAQAEEAVLSSMKDGLDAVIVNPSNIIGQYDMKNWSRLFSFVQQGKLPGIPPGVGSFCDAVEVARAHIAAYEHGRIGENYILAGTEASFLELVQSVACLLGKRKPTRASPSIILKAAGRVNEWISLLTEREPSLTPEMAAIFSARMIARSDKATRELGYHPVALNEMLRRCYDWLVAEGKL